MKMSSTYRFKVLQSNSFSYERFCTKTRFEAQGNSEMAYHNAGSWFILLAQRAGPIVIIADTSNADFLDTVHLDYVSNLDVL